MARDSYGGACTVRYTQVAPVNKLQEVRVAYDAQNVYFYISAKEKFTDYAGEENWLNIFLGTGDPVLKGWESYEYVIGMKFENGEASIRKFDVGFTTIYIGKAKVSQYSNVVQLSVPRSAIGLSAAKRFYFKVAAGVTEPSFIMNYYKSGSSLPMGRLSYMYYMK